MPNVMAALPNIGGSPRVRLFWKRTTGLVEWVLLRDGCPSCHPAVSVKALKGTQDTDPNQWPGLILSSSTTGLLAPLRWLSDPSALRHVPHRLPTVNFRTAQSLTATLCGCLWRFGVAATSLGASTKLLYVGPG